MYYPSGSFIHESETFPEVGQLFSSISKDGEIKQNDQVVIFAVKFKTPNVQGIEGRVVIYPKLQP